MKTIVVWVLLYGYAPNSATGGNSAVAISGIASREECERLGKLIAADAWLSPKYRCESYQSAAR